MNKIVKEAIASELVRICKIRQAYADNSWHVEGTAVLADDLVKNRWRVVNATRAGRVAAWPFAAACEWIAKNTPPALRRV